MFLLNGFVFYRLVHRPSHIPRLRAGASAGLRRPVEPPVARSRAARVVLGFGGSCGWRRSRRRVFHVRRRPQFPGAAWTDGAGRPAHPRGAAWIRFDAMARLWRVVRLGRPAVDDEAGAGHGVRQSIPAAGHSPVPVHQSGDCGRHRLQGVLFPVRAGDSLPIPGLGHSRPPRVRVRRVGRAALARRGGGADGPQEARSTSAGRSTGILRRNRSS